MSRRVLCGALSLLLVAAALASFAAAGTISYSETFQTTGQQATGTSATFTNYPDWTYEENGAGGSTAAVNEAGTLTISQIGSAGGTRIKSYVSAQKLAGQSSFDVSVNPLTVSAIVSGDGVAGGTSPGLLIGSIYFMYFPGYTDGGAKTGIADIRNDTSYPYRGYLGFVPGMNTKYAISLTVQEDSTHNYYNINYSITNLNDSSETRSDTYQGLKTVFGSLDKVGCFLESGSGQTGSYSNFTVSQVPEPSTTVLVGSGVAGLLFCAWRRRK